LSSERFFKMEVTRPDSIHSLTSLTSSILSGESKVKNLEDYEKQFQEV
jgi:hypothetical protein